MAKVALLLAAASAPGSPHLRPFGPLPARADLKGDPKAGWILTVHRLAELSDTINKDVSSACCHCEKLQLYLAVLRHSRCKATLHGDYYLEADISLIVKAQENNPPKVALSFRLDPQRNFQIKLFFLYFSSIHR